MTTFAAPLYVGGVPIVGSGGLMSQGNAYFVDPVRGSDSNGGKSIEEAVKTLSRAHALMTAGQNDVAYLLGNGVVSGSARESATLAWSKDACHIVGVAAYGLVAQRARIAATAGVNFTPLVNVTADGCNFINLHVYHGYDDASAQIAWQDGGERNAYYNCHFGGMGHATAAAQAGSRSFKLNGASAGLGEHYFSKCTFGLDTVDRAAANASVEIGNGAPRVIFDDCLFLARATDGGEVFVTIGSGGIDRYALFRRCVFHNFALSGGAAMTEALSVHASAGGNVILHYCTLYGATDWEAAAVSGRTFIDGAAPAGATSGLAVVVA